MQVRFNLINIIFVCLLVCIGIIIDNRVEARTLSKNLRAGALRNIEIYDLVNRKKRDVLDEQNDDDNDDITSSESSEENNNSSDLYVAHNMRATFNSDESEDSEELGDFSTQNDDDTDSSDHEFEVYISNNNGNNDADEDDDVDEDDDEEDSDDN